MTNQNQNNKIDFKGKIIIKLKIIAKTGLHIGGSAEVAKIGGVDNPIIRDPLTQQPYIPASSLKGKIRSLLEKYLGKELNKDGVHAPICKDADCEICRAFGSNEIGEGKIIFRDLFLSDESMNKLNKIKEEVGSESEVKFENTVSRLTGEATNPRQTERVPKGTEFKGEIIYNFVKKPNQNKDLLDKDLLKQDLKNLAIGFKLLIDDYLGGSGSRGYGEVEMKVEKVMVKKKKYYLGEEKQKEIEEASIENNFNLEEIKSYFFSSNND